MRAVFKSGSIRMVAVFLAAAPAGAVSQAARAATRTEASIASAVDEHLEVGEPSREHPRRMEKPSRAFDHTAKTVASVLEHRFSSSTPPAAISAATGRIIVRSQRPHRTEAARAPPR